MRRSAAAVSLWALVFYAIAALALDVIMARRRPYAAVPTLYSSKWKQLRRKTRTEPERPLLVMLGSSRVDMVFQAGRLEGLPGPEGRPLLAYNFGIPAAGPMHEHLYLDDMLRAGIRPSLLLVEFLPPLLTQPHSPLISEEGWIKPEWMNRHRFAGLYPYLAHPVGIADEWLGAYLAPWHAYREALNLGLRERLGLLPEPVLIPYYHDRWGCRCPQTLRPEYRSICLAGARGYVFALNRFRPGKGPIQAMKDLLERCHQERIPVALVLTPESRMFRSWYTPACRTTAAQLLAELRDHYGVKVIDATCWLDDEDFVDGHHANHGGATKFTVRLSEEAQRLLR